MYYKQNFVRQNQSSDYQQPSEGEERKLLRLWTEHGVSDSYQNIVLAFLDQFTDQQELSRQLIQELKLTYSKSTSFFKIKNLLMQRDRTIEYLYEWVMQLEKYKQVAEKQEPDLEKVCDIIDHLRKVHMLVSEEVTNMFQRYQCLPRHNQRDFVGSYYLKIFKTFDKDLEFLKTSLLKYYMPFSMGFDPLFLEQARQIRKLYTERRIVYDKNVEELFNINASYLYRLLRAHQKMLDYISINQQIENMEREPLSYGTRKNYVSNPVEHREIPITREPVRPAKQQYKQKHKDRTKTQPIQYEVPVVKLSKRIQSSKKSSSNRLRDEDSEQISISKNNIQPRQSKSRSNSPREQQIRSPQPLQSPRSKSRHNIDQNQSRDSQNITPESVKSRVVYSKAKHRQDEQHHTIQQQPQQNSPTSHRINELPKGLKKIKSKKVSDSPRMEKEYPSAKKFTNSTPKKHDGSQTMLRSRPKGLSIHVQSTKVHLPKIKESLKTQNQQDCFCRQKYKSKKHGDEQSEDEEEVISRRKAIIRNINEKYRRLAEREKRYELSKIGDPTYHKMKAKLKSKENSRIKSTTPRKSGFGTTTTDQHH